MAAGAVARYLSGSSQPSISSNFGAMCEMLSRQVRKHGSVQCRVCDGLGARDLDESELAAREREIEELEDRITAEKDQGRRDDLFKEQRSMRERLVGDSTCRACRGTGYITEARADMAHAMDSMWTTVRCGRCKGCGETFPPTDESADEQDICPRCDNGKSGLGERKGEGYIVPVTVKETGSSKKGKAPKTESGGDDLDVMPANDLATATWVDEDAMAEYGHVSREMASLRKRNPILAGAIESYYGPDGDKWGSHKWGRLFSIWHFTSAGKRLAQEGAGKTSEALVDRIHPLDLIASERDAEVRGDVGNYPRSKLIIQAEKQAREMLVAIEKAVGEMGQ